MNKQQHKQQYKQQQRNHIRGLRKDLDRKIKGVYDQQIVDNCLSFAPLNVASRIGSYLPMKNEVNTLLLHDQLLHKQWFVPRIIDQAASTMTFHSLEGDLVKNNLGILEPDKKCPSIKPSDLDVIIMPLLGFDNEGSRLGMGGGYYDRALSFKHSEEQPSKPLLIGLAYSFQQIEGLQSDTWDVPLDVIITEETII